MIMRSLIVVTEDGLQVRLFHRGKEPHLTLVVPVPMIDEIERECRVARARDQIHLQGLWIDSVRRVRNDVFDRSGEKSTTQFKVRGCCTDNEARYVLMRVSQLLGIKSELVSNYESKKDEGSKP